MDHTNKSGEPLLRFVRILIFSALFLGLVWRVPGTGMSFRLPDAAQAAGDPVIAAAGDIACDPSSSSFNNGNGTSGSCRQKYTSDLLVNAGLAAVLDLGDNQYYCGGYQAYVQSYDLSWGRVKSITHPSVGNHEYLTSGGTDCNANNAGAAGYFEYFGSAAGDPGKGYYSFDVGSWHLIALNSNCSSAGGCSATSAQGQWLEADLTAHSNACVLAYWHIPLFSSGGRANANSLPFWQKLYAHNADLILVGHDHIYERFAPQTPAGVVDTVRGIRQITVGSGGANHTSITSIAANSEVRDTSTFGVLKVTLHPSSFDWQFVPEAGKTFTDSGSQTCHGSGSTSDTTPPTAPTNLSATAVSATQVNLGWSASSDNVGVTGYRVFRNGNQIATTSSTTYTDSSVQGNTTYNYSVVAVDGAGNTSAASNTATVTTPAGSQGTTLTFTPTGDTYIRSDQPTSNFGAATSASTDNSPVSHILYKFAVSGTGGHAVTSVKLRLFCVDPSSFGGDFHRVADTTWSEGSVNWNNAPPADTTSLGSLGSVSTGIWYEVALTSLVTGDGVYSLRVISNSTNGADYSTKEGANPPQLVVQLAP